MSLTSNGVSRVGETGSEGAPPELRVVQLTQIRRTCPYKLNAVALSGISSSSSVSARPPRMLKSEIVQHFPCAKKVVKRNSF